MQKRKKKTSNEATITETIVSIQFSPWKVSFAINRHDINLIVDSISNRAQTI